MIALNEIRRVFLDMDGTIGQGETLYPTTKPFLRFLERRGIGYTILTNNSSIGTAEYLKKLRGTGIAAEAENLYTSLDYTVAYLRRNHPGIRRIHLLGMDAARTALESAGLALDDENPEAVVVAFDRTLTYEKLCRAAYFLSRGIPGFATHPDVYCPTDRKTWLVDCGAITRALEVSTNTRLKVLGKPDPDMLREAARRCRIPVEACLMVGDRLATDIALGLNAGALTCHISAPESEFITPAGIVPDYRVRDLGELQMLWENQEKSCRDWQKTAGACIVSNGTYENEKTEVRR